MRSVQLENGSQQQVRVNLSPEAEPELRSLERRAFWLWEQVNRPLHARMDPPLLVHFNR